MDGVIPLVAGTAALAIAAYWMLARPGGTMRGAAIAIGLGGLLCAWAAVRDDASDDSPGRGRVPLVITIAFDLSPSMLAQPAPNVSGSMPPRYERARTVLDAVLEGLEVSGQSSLLSLVGFADDGSTLSGWLDRPSDVRELLGVLAMPELFGSRGTSLESASRAVVGLFELLPAELADAQRLVILVSDGESTMRQGDIRYAAERLARSRAPVIALHVGLEERDEGIPVYDAIGEFQGFRVLGGRRYTKPDAEAMRLLSDGGLFVRAEDPRASERILAELLPAERDAPIDADTLPLLGVFMATLVSLGLMIR